MLLAYRVREAAGEVDIPRGCVPQGSSSPGTAGQVQRNEHCETDGPDVVAARWAAAKGEQSQPEVPGVRPAGRPDEQRDHPAVSALSSTDSGWAASKVADRSEGVARRSPAKPRLPRPPTR